MTRDSTGISGVRETIQQSAQQQWATRIVGTVMLVALAIMGVLHGAPHSWVEFAFAGLLGTLGALALMPVNALKVIELLADKLPFGKKDA